MFRNYILYFDFYRSLHHLANPTMSDYSYMSEEELSELRDHEVEKLTRFAEYVKTLKHASEINPRMLKKKLVNFAESFSTYKQLQLEIELIVSEGMFNSYLEEYREIGTMYWETRKAVDDIIEKYRVNKAQLRSSQNPKDNHGATTLKVSDATNSKVTSLSPASKLIDTVEHVEERQKTPPETQPCSESSKKIVDADDQHHNAPTATGEPYKDLCDANPVKSTNQAETLLNRSDTIRVRKFSILQNVQQQLKDLEKTYRAAEYVISKKPFCTKFRRKLIRQNKRKLPNDADNFYDKIILTTIKETIEMIKTTVLCSDCFQKIDLFGMDTGKYCSKKKFTPQHADEQVTSTSTSSNAENSTTSLNLDE